MKFQTSGIMRYDGSLNHILTTDYIRYLYTFRYTSDTLYTFRYTFQVHYIHSDNTFQINFCHHSVIILSSFCNHRHHFVIIYSPLSSFLSPLSSFLSPFCHHFVIILLSLSSFCHHFVTAQLLGTVSLGNRMTIDSPSLGEQPCQVSSPYLY